MMASTARSVKFRQKLKIPENESLKNEYKVKEKGYVQKYMKNLMENEEKKKKFNERKRENQKKYRDKIKQNREHPVMEIISNPAVSTSFKSASAATRALQKAEKALLDNLPSKKDEKNEILTKIFKRHNIEPPSNPIIPKKRVRKDFIAKKVMVEDFYECDLVSRANPGLRDYVRVKNDSGVYEKIQSYSLKFPISRAYEIYQQTFPQFPVSNSYFANSRPKYVKLYSDTKHETCLCQICENFEYLIEGISRYMSFKYSAYDLLIKLQCHHENFNCAFNECDECKNIDIIFKSILMSCCEEEKFEYKKWEKDENFYRETTIKDVLMKDAVKIIKNDFILYKRHKFIANVQKKTLKKLIEDLKDNEAIITMDFAERFLTKQRKEIQASYFGKKQITLFTVRAYVGKNDYSFVIASDELSQSKEMVFAYVHDIIVRLKVPHPTLDHVKAFTDGCAAQFKNRFNFVNLLFSQIDHQVSMEWHFFGTGHGKSACDGLGGSIKRNVHRRAISEDFEVFTASQFVTCASLFTDKIIIYEMTKNDIEKVTKHLANRWKKVKTIPGTQSFHFYRPSDNPGCILASKTSTSNDVVEFKMI